MKNRLLRRNVLMSLVLVSVFLLAVAADGSHDDRSAGRPAPYAFLQPLTAKERAWLRDHPVIRVVQDPGWPPVEFTDESEEPSGMAGDYLSLIEQRLGQTTHYSVVPASIKDDK